MLAVNEMNNKLTDLSYEAIIPVIMQNEQYLRHESAVSALINVNDLDLVLQ